MMNSVRDRVAIGVDIGGTKIAFALVTERGEMLAQHRLPSAPSEGAEAVFDRVAEGVHWLFRDRDESVAGVGVGCPGHLNPDTGVVYGASNLAWLNVPLKEGLARRLPSSL